VSEVSFVLFLGLEDVGQTAFSAVLTIEVASHEGTGTTVGGWAFSSQSSDLAVFVDFVVFENSQLDLLLLMSDLLWFGVILLLSLFASSSQSQHKVKSGFLLNVVITQSSSVFQLFSSENQSLLIWGDSFFVLDLGLDILDGVRALDLEGDGLAREGLDEDLHPHSL